MKTAIRHTICAAALLSVGACAQVQDYSDRVSNTVSGWFSSPKTVEKPMVEPAACPTVKLVDDLKNVVQFVDMANPAPATEVSRASLDDLKTSCVAKGETLSVQIDLTLGGRLGPKGRQNADDRASFAYPYFVAVTNPKGEILAKEIFAASVAYPPGQNAATQVETITQTVPREKDPEAPSTYSILVGFQLSDEQLGYNRATTGDFAQ